MGSQNLLEAGEMHNQAFSNEMQVKLLKLQMKNKVNLELLPQYLILP